jgi:hypothetical protein
MNSTEANKQQPVAPVPEKKPNEVGGFYFSSFLKISDPNTKEILVQTRGDN